MICFQRGFFILILWVLSSLTLKHLTVKHVKVSALALALFQRDLFDGQRKGQHPQSNVGVEMFCMVGGSIFIRGYHDNVAVWWVMVFSTLGVG